MNFEQKQEFADAKRANRSRCFCECRPWYWQCHQSNGDVFVLANASRTSWRSIQGGSVSKGRYKGIGTCRRSIRTDTVEHSQTNWGRREASCECNRFRLQWSVVGRTFGFDCSIVGLHGSSDHTELYRKYVLSFEVSIDRWHLQQFGTSKLGCIADRISSIGQTHLWEWLEHADRMGKGEIVLWISETVGTIGLHQRHFNERNHSRWSHHAYGDAVGPISGSWSRSCHTVGQFGKLGRCRL